MPACLIDFVARTQYMRWLGLVVFLLFADVLAVPLLIFGFLYKNRVKVCFACLVPRASCFARHLIPRWLL